MTTNWQEEYKKTKLATLGSSCFECCDYEDIDEDMQLFITTLLEKQKEEKEINISMLRQWLNEDRITDPTKMITNDDIKHWLKSHDKTI